MATDIMESAAVQVNEKPVNEDSVEGIIDNINTNDDAINNSDMNGLEGYDRADNGDTSQTVSKRSDKKKNRKNKDKLDNNDTELLDNNTDIVTHEDMDDDILVSTLKTVKKKKTKKPKDTTLNDIDATDAATLHTEEESVVFKVEEKSNVKSKKKRDKKNFDTEYDVAELLSMYDETKPQAASIQEIAPHIVPATDTALLTAEDQPKSKTEISYNNTDDIQQMNSTDDILQVNSTDDILQVNNTDDMYTDGAHTVKTSAQKKQEKKDRDRERKKKKQTDKPRDTAEGMSRDTAEDKPRDTAEDKFRDIAEDKPRDTAEDVPDIDEVIDTAVPTTTDNQTIEDSIAPEGASADPSIKVKIKKGAKSDKKEKKGPTKAIRDRLKQALDEEKQRQEQKEEEERRKELEAIERENLRLEKEQLEKERKERQKLKKKDRIARQKAEGTYVSREERQERELRLRKIEELKAAQGNTGVLPTTAETPDEDNTMDSGKVRYGHRIRTKNQATTDFSSNATLQTNSAEHTTENDLPQPSLNSNTTTTNNNDDNNDSNNNSNSINSNNNNKVLGKNGRKIKEHWDDSSESESSSDNEAAPSNENKTVDENNVDANNNDESSTSSSTDSESESDSEGEVSSFEKIKERITKRRLSAISAQSMEKLRSPIICVLGHVDTGKTKLLDKIRHTSVQEGEAGGITQQIGATFIPRDAILSQTKVLKEFTSKTAVSVPGLLIIDTPGHESFSNLRTRGSSLCDIAILVIDLMQGLEKQTKESINLLLKRNTKFVIALNKVDRIYDWRRNPMSSIKDNLKKQKKHSIDDYNERVDAIKLQLNELGLNVAMFWEKVKFDEYYPMIPTSAHSGDGMADLIAMIVLYCQKYLIKSLMWSSEPQASVLEVKVIPGYGVTIDIILKNGVLKVNDTIIIIGMEGPIVTQIKTLLTPQPMRELRVKGEYIHYQIIDSSQGIKISAKDLDKAIAGSQLLVAAKPDEIDVLVDEISSEMEHALKSFKLADRGVFVQSSTLGSLEALLCFLNAPDTYSAVKTPPIPYAGLNIGPIHKKDVIKCSAMLEHDKLFAVILAFDVSVDKEAQEFADAMGIRIFTAAIMYNLYDMYLKHGEEYRARMKSEHKHLAVYPCRLSVVPGCIFNTRDPIVIGVKVEEGILTNHTPICVPTKNVDLGIITSIESFHKAVESVRQGTEICIKIESLPGEAPKMFERHFDSNDMLYSRISRQSIDVMKKYFKDELETDDWRLVIKMKKIFSII